MHMYMNERVFYVHINLVVYVGMYVHMCEGTNGWINRPRGVG